MSIKKDFCITDKTCHICYKTFSGRSQLYRHLREVHNEYEKLNSFYEKNECIFKCLEGCDVSFRFNRDLRHHLNGCHNFNIREVCKRFSSFEDFQEWFLQLQEDGAQFIKHRGAEIKDKKVTYYSCNRSGISRIKTNDRKRQPKKIGTRKINSGCTSFLKLEEHDEYCEVFYCDFHYGHKIELEHLPLPLESRAAIVDKLANGAKLVKIDLKNEDIEFDRIQRSDLLTRSDVKNLKYFCKSKKVKLTLPELTDEDDADFEKDVFTNLQATKEEVVCHDNEYFNNENNDKLNDYIDPNKNIPDCSSLVLAGRNEVKEMEQKEIQTIETEEAADEKSNDENSSTGNHENIEIHYVEDTEEISDTEEDVFGYYVAAVLKQLEPVHKVSARNQINEILQKFLTKK